MCIYIICMCIYIYIYTHTHIHIPEGVVYRSFCLREMPRHAESDAVCAENLHLPPGERAGGTTIGLSQCDPIQSDTSKCVRPIGKEYKHTNVEARSRPMLKVTEFLDLGFLVMRICTT